MTKLRSRWWVPVRGTDALAKGLLEAAGDNDPKLGLVLKYRRTEGWAERGCIMFSQYLDTVLWIASHLATAFVDRRVAVYGGQGYCFLWEGGSRRGAERDEIQNWSRMDDCA